MSKVLSVRVDDAVAARVEELAAGRSIKAGVWLKEAVASYLDDHERGTPDAPAAPATDLAAARARSRTSGVTPEEYAERMRERDEILAKARASVRRG